MTTQIVFGTLLVLLSWLAVVILLHAIGRTIVMWVKGEAAPKDTHWRMSLWWGTAVLTGLIVALSLVLPLNSSLVAVVLIGVALSGAGVSWILRPPHFPSWSRPSWNVAVWMAAIAGAVVYLAAKALGPVTNYDSGLYHLGLIQYSFDYSVIPGLANLYFPFGYANAQFPLAAVLGNGPWEGVGYRLLNGAVLVVVVADLMSRVLNRRWSWGTFVLLIGVSASLLPMVVLADDMVTSPTSDTSVMLLSLVSATYLADALEQSKLRSTNATIALILAALTVVFRPTMAIFAVGTVIVVFIVILRGTPKPHLSGRPVAATFLVLILLSMSSLVRDAFLSGWLVYPLSMLPLSVSWLSMDPSPWRTATLAAARDPGSSDGYLTANSWDWIGAWIARLPQQWEPWFLGTGLLTLVIVMWWSRKMHLPAGARRKLLLALAPSLLAVTAWFVLSPPSFRFIWGPLFLLLYLPLGMWTQALRGDLAAYPTAQTPTGRFVVACALAVATATSISLLERNQFSTITEPRSWDFGVLSIPYAVTPIPQPATQEVETQSGLVITKPVVGDQCWGNYPLCTFLTSGEIALRGTTIQEGFERNQ